MQNKVKPLLRGHFHQEMFFISLGACLPLFFRGQTTIERIAIFVYSLGLLTMFGVSAIYHRITWNISKRAFFKKLDHSAIYLMIAGTFTPIALLALSETSAKTLLITIWLVAMAGIVQSIFFVNLPKYVSASIYVVAGYLVLPYLSEIKNSIGLFNTGLLLTGGIIYSVGAVFYGLKRPIIKPEIFGYHELFHVLVCLAAILHFIVINSLIN